MKKNNIKLFITMISIILVFVITLAGTFAWSLIEESETGGQGQSYDYLVKLMDESTDPLIIKNNWRVGEILDKKVYATSSYNNSTIKSSYDIITINNAEAIFSDTWIRIKIEETLTKNGIADSKMINELNDGKVVSRFIDHFQLINSGQTNIITLEEWDGVSKGRFWILDETTSWLYWAQPVEKTEYNEDLPDQTTDLIMDSVLLINAPAGSWKYTIKATLDAIDVELDGYYDQDAWNDISGDDKIFSLFE